MILNGSIHWGTRALATRRLNVQLHQHMPTAVELMQPKPAVCAKTVWTTLSGWIPWGTLVLLTPRQSAQQLWHTQILMELMQRKHVVCVKEQQAQQSHWRQHALIMPNGMIPLDMIARHTQPMNVLTQQDMLVLEFLLPQLAVFAEEAQLQLLRLPRQLQTQLQHQNQFLQKLPSFQRKSLLQLLPL